MRFDSRISIANIFAVVLAFVAMVGGWYKFDFRVSATEQEIASVQRAIQKHDDDLQKTLDTHDANDQKLADTLERTNQVMGAVIQALDDHNIHVRGGEFRRNQ
jgi:hypothetical protein